MQGTTYRLPHEQPLAERPTVVRARRTDREELSIAPSDEHGLALRVTEEHASVRDQSERNASSKIRALQFLLTTHVSNLNY